MIHLGFKAAVDESVDDPLAPTRVFSQKARKTVGPGALRKQGSIPDPEDPEDGRNLSRDAFGPYALPSTGTIVSPEMDTHEIVDKLGRMEMSRDEKAGYLGKAGFQPRAISAILAQVDERMGAETGTG